MATDEPIERSVWKGRHDVHTLIYNAAESKQLAVLNAAIWPPVGSVFEIGKPNRDCVVVGVRLLIATPGEGGDVSILVEVNEGDPGDFIPRDPARRLLADE